MANYVSAGGISDLGGYGGKGTGGYSVRNYSIDLERESYVTADKYSRKSRESNSSVGFGKVAVNYDTEKGGKYSIGIYGGVVMKNPASELEARYGKLYAPKRSNGNYGLAGMLKNYLKSSYSNPNGFDDVYLPRKGTTLEEMMRGKR